MNVFGFFFFIFSLSTKNISHHWKKLKKDFLWKVSRYKKLYMRNLYWMHFKLPFKSCFQNTIKRFFIQRISVKWCRLSQKFSTFRIKLPPKKRNKKWRKSFSSCTVEAGSVLFCVLSEKFSICFETWETTFSNF